MDKLTDFALVAGIATLVHPKLGGAVALSLVLFGLFDGGPGAAMLMLVAGVFGAVPGFILRFVLMEVVEWYRRRAAARKV